MSETTTICPHCETHNQYGSAACANCGTLLRVDTPPEPEQVRRRSPVLANVIAGLFSLLLFGLAFQNWRNPDAVVLAFRPTATITTTPTPTVIIPNTPTITPSPTPTNTPTVVPSPTPTNTPTPVPIATPQSPYTHTINAGEVLFNVALAYNVTIGSILDSNEGLSPEGLIVGQEIVVPRPTAAPPLVPVDITINGEPAVADPTDCIQHEIAQDETLFGIALLYDVTVDALLRMNRIDENAYLRIGDVVCVPTIIFNAKAISLDSSLLQRSSASINRPMMLYPSAGSTLTQTPLTLQWIAERDLAANEHYMVELSYLDDFNSRPIRAFTRQTSWQLPDGADGRYRWRLSFVLVNEDNSYKWNGPASERTFTLAQP